MTSPSNRGAPASTEPRINDRIRVPEVRLVGPNGEQVGPTDRSPRDRVGRDPLGRPTSSDGAFDQSDVKIPDENILQKSRQILNELRRRAGERSRPVIELDYIERLLKRF